MKSDDEDGFREFVTARMGSLRNLAYVTCGDWHAADDAVANALAKLYPRWGKVERPDLYAQTMVFRAAIDETRRPWWRRERPVGDAMPEVAGADPSAATDERLRVQDALRTVPPRQRAVLMLRYYLGLSTDEAAEVLGVRAGTVSSQTARGLVQLRAALAVRNVEFRETNDRGEWTDAAAHARRGGPGDIRAAAPAPHR